MSYLRTIGDNISLALKDAEWSVLDFSDKVGLSEFDLQRVIEGRLVLDGKTMSIVASSLKMTIGELEHEKDPQEYAKLIHCMGRFNKAENKDLILDYIDFYIGIQEAKEEN